MLLGRARQQDEELVAAGAVTGAARKIFGNCTCALALGRWRAADLRGRCLLTLPITPTLRLPTLLAVTARTGTEASADSIRSCDMTSKPFISGKSMSVRMSCGLIRCAISSA